MFYKFARGLVTFLGVIIGPALVVLAYQLLSFFKIANPYTDWPPYLNIVTFVGIGLFSGIIFFFLSKRIVRFFQNAAQATEKELQKIPASAVVFGSIGLVIGLLIAFLISGLFRSLLSWVQVVISVVLYLFLGLLGWRTGVRRRVELSRLFRRSREGEKEGADGASLYPKVLDTSALIDGRIQDVCATGFVEGTLIVPSFVLRELRHIADSSDTNRRNRGRRGLDVVHTMQTNPDIHLIIEEQDFEDVPEVDEKLLRLAKVLNGKVVTNDYNLNKIAQVQKVKVLNINDLANAMKSVLLSGEQLELQIMREGKEAGQGIAYLADGTMVVVEGARKRVGDTVQVEVTSVLQTSAGRMVFAKLV